MDAVLVVEDEQPMRSLLERWLRSSGYHARVAASADEALTAVRPTAPAVAICDLIMPGHDGAWLARQLRSRCPDTALIVATGAPNPSDLGDLPGEIVEYLFKPFTRERLTLAVQRALSWHRSQGARRWSNQLAKEHLDRWRDVYDRWHASEIDSRETLVAVLARLFADHDGAFDHAMRVSRLASLACRQLGLSGEETEEIERAALLHDLGKLALPEAILAKPAPLSPEERDLVRRSPEIAYEFVRGHSLLGRLADLVRGTTEWYGGGGYPAGLAGDAIPLGSRVVAVAEAYDAMTHYRVYRDTITPSGAVIELIRCCPSQFDPRVVAAFLDGLTAH